MKKYLLVLAIAALAWQLPAQTNEAVKLGLIAETPEASQACDLLTATLSGNGNIQLLERSEIEKVYSEQGLSAANRDDVKLGRVLGADGLLFLNILRTSRSTNLTARLVAVKPGVILTEGSFGWPIKDASSWTESVGNYLNTFLPKLSLSAADAIPISVVNLRSALQTGESQETERQLKLLTILRLSQERQIFVLERQKMQSLGEEKNLNSDESAFWDGSYLLDGTVDQNGYSKDTITINAQLTPRKGGAPLQFEVSGSRTNLAEVVNSLATNIMLLLKVSATVNEWNAADEATKYFEEAQWAYGWRLYGEAEAAANSAWALGKKNLECAKLQVKTYLAELSENISGFGQCGATFSSGFTADNKPLGPPPSEARIQAMIREYQAPVPHPIHFRVNRFDSVSTVEVVYKCINSPPIPTNIDRARYLLELYYNYSRTHADGVPIAATMTNGNSEWYNLGVDVLTAVSEVLENFDAVPESQKPVADGLAELRSSARTVAGWISAVPSVRDSYFVGDRVAVYDELDHTIMESPNIFACEVKYGCYWQEKPEDGIALYRNLMRSPVFSYIHKDFWLDDVQTPRLAAWNDEDRQRPPQLQDNFIQELKTSTNVLWQLEGRALAYANAENEADMCNAFTNLFNGIFDNKDALIQNKVDVLYLNWGVGSLMDGTVGGDVATKVKDSLSFLYYSDYSHRIEAMEREYRDKTVAAEKLLSVFAEQKQFLAKNAPYDFFVFVKLFQSRDYTRSQALEIQPLVAAYKSNLVAQSQNASPMQKSQLTAAVFFVGILGNDVNRILNPPVTPPPPVQIQAPPKVVVKAPEIPNAVTNIPEVVTNVVTFNDFLDMPLTGLSGDELQSNSVCIRGHHWCEGKLLLDIQYEAALYSFDAKGNWNETRYATYSCVAILDPAIRSWNVIACPETSGNEIVAPTFQSIIYNGELFTCGNGHIEKYDFANREWRKLEVSNIGAGGLCSVNGHLYAGSDSMICEIIDEGKSMHILASTRRQPPESALDTESLWMSALFEGPDHSLRVGTQSKIFTWTGSDWHEDFAAPPSSFTPTIFDHGVLFLTDGFNAAPRVSRLMTGGNKVEYCFGQKRPDGIVLDYSQQKRVEEQPMWKLPQGMYLTQLPVAARGSNLYFLADHSQAQDVFDKRLGGVIGQKFLPKDGYHAKLLCYEPDIPFPVNVFLKFDNPNGNPPLTGKDPGSRPQFGLIREKSPWMLFTTNYLFFGLESSEPPAQSGAPDALYKTGVWMLPVQQLDAAAEKQKIVRVRQQEHDDVERAAADEKIRKEVLAKYDKNHNGIIDREEREEALDDPTFIEFELDEIDINHNDLLDIEELKWFDANDNRVLDPKKQAGINLAIHFLAGRLLKRFDTGGNGELNMSDCNDLLAYIHGNWQTPDFYTDFYHMDKNHDNVIDLAELEAFLKERMLANLRAHGGWQPPTPPHFMPTPFGPQHFAAPSFGPGQAIDYDQEIKTAVELYWRKTNGATNEP